MLVGDDLNGRRKEGIMQNKKNGKADIGGYKAIKNRADALVQGSFTTQVRYYKPESLKDEKIFTQNRHLNKKSMKKDEMNISTATSMMYYL
jgi:hypothetical protein